MHVIVKLERRFHTILIMKLSFFCEKRREVIWFEKLYSCACCSISSWPGTNSQTILSKRKPSTGRSVLGRLSFNFPEATGSRREQRREK